ncbi:glycosyltransferase family 2 protein [Acinetobacter pseudolwoffii]|uniref:glycosyltransferase family 2 protein n=1 Tax=Acinetobacter pseudolwoffii TaxID=2053287 RepID=UPI002577BB40|nr:glycosyltransferase family A protein [Acinetobacter pseudolwoffii]MDM1344684.1 glycosyltransferase family 2 protein [Acinetobacter pseudolwoffii]
MFSVVVPLYNKELSIRNTIQSVLNQSYQNFEIIVVNDGSTDNSLKTISEIQDSRIRVVNQENQGVSAARNSGIKESKYEWVAFLDGDDLWERDHLEEIIKMIDIFPNEKVYVTSFEYSDKRKMFKHKRNSSIFKIENYFLEAIKESLIWTSIVVVHKSCFEKVGFFNKQLNRGEDLDLWSRLARVYKVVKSSKVTAVYRVEAENRSYLSFDIMKSRVFMYDFSEATSLDERIYYEDQIIKALRGFIVKRSFKNFFLLFKKHLKNISIIKLLKI